MTTTTDRARELGRSRGLARASWVFDGNTPQETYKTFLRGYDEGDPAVLDAFEPMTGWLSGEDADGPSPASLAEQLGLVAEGELSMAELTKMHAELDELCEAYEEAAEAAYWAELERVARLHTTEEE